MSTARLVLCLLLSLALIACGDGGGGDGACTVTENGDGTLSITCPDGPSGTVRWVSPDGDPSGADGLDVPALDSASMDAPADGGNVSGGDGDSLGLDSQGDNSGWDVEDPDALELDAGGPDGPDDDDAAAQVDGDVQLDAPGGPDGSDSGPISDSGDGGGPIPMNCDELPVCEDFESSTVGSEPDPASWQVVSPNCSGDGTIVVDDAFAHSGSQSIRLDSSGGYCNHVFASPTGSIGPVGEPLYGRFYVRFGTALDMAHVTFLAMKDQTQDKDLRMGGQNEILMWNRELDDATLPELSPTGMSMSIKPPAHEWLCIEFLVDGDAGTLSTWVDGDLIEGLVIDGEPTPDVDNQWLNMPWKPELTDARFGWESYGGAPMTLWYDDIVLSQSPIGCLN